MSAKRKIKCPRCGTLTEYSTDKAYRPFCSERCQLIDFDAWASEKYAIPHSPANANDMAQLEGEDSDNDIDENSSDENKRM